MKPSAILNELFVLDSSSMTWEAPKIAGEVPPACANTAMATIGSTIYLFGGTGLTGEEEQKDASLVEV